MNHFIYILSDIRRKGQLGSEGQPAGPSPSRAQVQYVGMNNTGARAGDPSPETRPGDTEAPGAAARGLCGAEAALGEKGASWLTTAAPRVLRPPRNPSPHLVNDAGMWVTS